MYLTNNVTPIRWRPDVVFNVLARGLQAILRGTCPVTAASSDGRRNTCSKFTRRSLKSQGLSWALIQAQRDSVEMRLRVDR